MNKIIAALIFSVAISMGALAYFNLIYIPKITPAEDGIIKLDNRVGNFSVYQNGNFIRTFKNSDDAIAFAKGYTQTYIIQNGSKKWFWDNYPQFSVLYDGEEYLFYKISEAAAYARGKKDALILNRANKARIWNYADKLPKRYTIQNVPLIAQKPELPRGCEVTSLAMLMNYYGIGVSKMDLAEQIRKDPAKYKEDKDGNITFGNPELGFVGDMYDLSNPGLGVYHGPIFDLLKAHIGNPALDLTGCDFNELYYFVAKNKPVWVITNATFKQLEADKFSKWTTSEGKDIIVTNYEHSVLIKGYDEENIYFNNPLNGESTESAPKAEFIAAWRQMGSQAVSYFE